MEVKINVKEMNSAIEDQAGRVNTSKAKVELNSILPIPLTKYIQNNKIQSTKTQEASSQRDMCA